MISVASSLKFRKDDNLLPSFDNTMFADEQHFRVAKHCYYQKLYAADTITIQAEVESGQSLGMSYSAGTLRQGYVSWGPWQSIAGESKVFTGTTYDYWEVDLAMAGYSTGYVKFAAAIIEDEVIQETWYSEPVEIVEASSRYLQIEYFNFENDFNVFYDNETEANRISHLLRIAGTLRKYKPGGEASVFDNQNEVVKTADEVKRIMTLETEAIPAYLAEMLAVAMAHDKFFINEVEFVAENKPEYETGNGDLSSLTCALTQRDVIGLNAHDTGYNCDAVTTNDMTILQESAASGEKSFAITDDHMILTITGERVANSPVIKAGTTPGGDDILMDMSLVAVTNPIEVALIPVDKAAITGGVLYVTVSGAGATANIYIATFKNRQ